MKAVDFPERNILLAEDQPEYETLPVYADVLVAEESTVDEKGNLHNVEKPYINSMTACFELSDEEIEELVRTRKLWYTQMLFGNQFQPVCLSTQNPFTEAKTEVPNG